MCPGNNHHISWVLLKKTLLTKAHNFILWKRPGKHLKIQKTLIVLTIWEWAYSKLKSCCWPQRPFKVLSAIQMLMQIRSWLVKNPPVESVPKQLTGPSQRETLQHLQGETGYFYTSHASTRVTRRPEAELQVILISIRRLSSRGYLDHLLHLSRGLSNPAAGLFRRVPSRPSWLHLSRLHGSARGTSCTAAEQCGRPQCCRGFPPECSGLGAARGKGRKVKAVTVSVAAFDITECTLRMERKTPPLSLEESERKSPASIMKTSDKIWQPLPQWWFVLVRWKMFRAHPGLHHHYRVETWLIG